MWLCSIFHLLDAGTQWHQDFKCMLCLAEDLLSSLLDTFKFISQLFLVKADLLI